MKFILAFLLLSNASVPGMSGNGNEKTVCNFIPDDLYKGLSVLIDTDKSGFGPPTQGDVSIANALTTGSGSDFPSIKAICTLTAADPSDSPPFCTLETTLADGKIMATGTPPELVVMGGTGAYYRASGMMTTAEDFVRDDSTGVISFNARIDFCLPNDGGSNPIPIPITDPFPIPITDPIPITNPNEPKCQDDKSWSTSHNGKQITCNKVKNKPGKHCAKNGASTACPKSCGFCPVPFQ